MAIKLLNPLHKLHAGRFFSTNIAVWGCMREPCRCMHAALGPCFPQSGRRKAQPLDPRLIDNHIHWKKTDHNTSLWPLAHSTRPVLLASNTQRCCFPVEHALLAASAKVDRSSGTWFRWKILVDSCFAPFLSVRSLTRSSLKETGERGKGRKER